MNPMILALGAEPLPERDAPTINRLLADLQGRVLTLMLRRSAFLALAAVLLSPPAVAAYSIWPAALAVIWLLGAVISWQLCELGHKRAAATAFVVLTWLSFTVPDLLSAERFSAGDIVAAMVICALLLPWRALVILVLAWLTLVAGAVALDGTGHPLPLLFPASSYLRLAATIVQMSVVAIALWIAKGELRAAVGSGVIEAWARREAEKASRESEEKYRTLFAQSADASLVLDEGCFVDCNAAAVELFRAEKNRILGTHPADWSPELQADGQSSLDKARQLIDQARRDGSARFEWTHRRTDGSLIEAEVALTALQYEGRTVLHAAVRDATTRIRAQEALRVSEAQLLANLQNTPNVAIQWYDKDGRVLFWNNASEAIYGWTPEQAVGKTAHALMYASGETPQFLQVLEEIGRTGKPYGPREQQVRRGDGSTGWVVATIFRIVMGKGDTGFVCMHVDITDRIRAERKLAESERRYRSLFESAMDCILIIDPAARLVDLNHQASVTLGYTREELLGESFARILDGHAMSRLYPRPSDVLVERRSIRGEQELRAKDGAVRYVEFVASPLPDGNVLAVVRDVTERRRAANSICALNEQLEQRVAEQTAELREANRELESFSYSVSHDLRAPLRAIIGFIGILREDYGATLAGEAMRYLEQVERNAARMERLIRDLLRFAQAARGEFVQLRVDTRQVVDAAIEEHRTVWGDRARVEIGSLPAVSGDPGLLRQVWGNLIGNAMKYSSKVAKPMIEIGGAEAGETAEFWIKDNGAGFDMAHAWKLFGVFQRLHSSAEFEGTGIGLATVQRIVHRYGGTVRAEARVGAGATFHFTLPACRVSGNEPAGPAAAASGRDV